MPSGQTDEAAVRADDTGNAAADFIRGGGSP
jgi:hypothetical protein